MLRNAIVPTTARRALRVAIVVPLALAPVACGGDGVESTGPADAGRTGRSEAGDGGARSTEGTGGAETTEASAGDGFCGAAQAVIEMDTPMEASGEAVNDYAARLAEHYEVLVAEAPEGEVKTALEERAAVISQVAETGEPGEEPPGLDAAAAGHAADVCDWASMDVTATDYVFKGLPADVDAGPTVITLTNAAPMERHEMVLFRKNDGVTDSIEDLVALPEEEAMSKLTLEGVAFARPGETSTAAVSLEPGEYAALCFVPIGGDQEAPPHFVHGMQAEFTVT